jgi:hypothetical protein
MASQVYNTSGTFTFTIPAGVTTVTLEAWGGGGGGGGLNGVYEGSAGGGGAYNAYTGLAVTPGSGYTIRVGNSGLGGGTDGTDGEESYVYKTSDGIGNKLVRADGGKKGVRGSNLGTAGGNGGSSFFTGTLTRLGGAGGNGGAGAGIGGGSGGPAANGTPGGTQFEGIYGAGGGGTAAVAVNDSGNGAARGSAANADINMPGGGGGGAVVSVTNGRNGAVGQVRITWYDPAQFFGIF